MSGFSGRPIRILVVDDSAAIRKLLTQLISSDPGLQVVGTAVDPFEARDKLVALKPDLMTLDIDMPRMDGITFLQKVMQHFPTRTVIISGLSSRMSAIGLRALELGAIDVIEKPSAGSGSERELIERIKSAGKAQLMGAHANSAATQTNPTARAAQPAFRPLDRVIAIASSTGGTEALKAVLPLLPTDTPGIVIVQHMPPVFTHTYAEHLQRLCPFEVKEAEHGDRVQPGRALIAPGDSHMEIVKSGGICSVVLHQQPRLHGVRPAADYLLKSVAKHLGPRAIGLVLTGMGRDGAEGLLAMKAAGSFNIGQDEASCVVYGMPKAAADAGAIDLELPLNRIAAKLMELVRRREAA